jgi:hypothetical protein
MAAIYWLAALHECIRSGCKNAILWRHIGSAANSISCMLSRSKSLRLKLIYKKGCVSRMFWAGLRLHFWNELGITTIRLPPGPYSVWPTSSLAFHRHIKAADVHCFGVLLLRLVCFHLQSLKRLPRKKLNSPREREDRCSCFYLKWRIFVYLMASARSTSAQLVIVLLPINFSSELIKITSARWNERELLNCCSQNQFFNKVQGDRMCRTDSRVEQCFDWTQHQIKAVGRHVCHIDVHVPLLPLLTGRQLS